MRSLLAIGVLGVASAALGADDFRVIKLEQDVRTLERQVQTLLRQVEELRMQRSRDGNFGVAPAREPERPERGQEWLVAAHWEQIRPGMDELEVIELLGVPSSMRHEDDRRILLYALEIGSSGFLGGSVVLRNAVVVAVERPTLK